MLRASIDDQDLFNQLADDEEERVLLLEASVRRKMIEATHGEETSLAARFRAWWTLGRGVAVVSIAVASIALMVTIQRSAVERLTIPDDLELTTSSSHSDRSLAGSLDPDLGARLFQFPQSPQTNAVELLLSTPALRIGDTFRLRFRVSEPLRVIVVERRPDGSFVQLYPWMISSVTSIAANEEVFIPPSGQGDLRVAGPAGRRTVRLLAFPDSAGGIDLSAGNGFVESPEYVVEREYNVLSATGGAR